MKGHIGAVYIDPAALIRAAEKQGIQNPKKLADETGVSYETCYLIWKKGRILNPKLEVVTRFCHVLLVKPAALLAYSKEVEYGQTLLAEE
ncbi:MAG: helix-turn-helix domain-containing protein [Acidobacteria bacterium]|nr:helix-turn-helix domain-containing protein [Acidobacteriota bacterium]